MPLAVNATFVQSVAGDRTNLAFVAEGHQLHAWDLATGTVLAASPFDFGEPIQGLSARRDRIAVAGATKAMVWTPTPTAPFPTTTTFTLTGSAVTAVALSERWLSVAHSTQIDIHWLDLVTPVQTIGSLPASILVLRAGTGPLEEGELVFNQGTKLAVARISANPPPTVLWAYPDPTTNPGQVTCSLPDHSIITCHNNRPRRWQPLSIWRLSNRRGCRAHVAAALKGRTPDQQFLSARIVQEASGQALVRLHVLAGSIHPLIPVIRDRGAFGFLAFPLSPFSKNGREVFSLGVAPKSGIAWTRLKETVERQPAQIVWHRGDGTPFPTLSCTVDKVELNAVTVQPDAAATVQTTRVVTARVQVSFPSPSSAKVTLHLGEHVLDASLTTPLALLAHLEASWQTATGPTGRAVQMQGPVAITVDWNSSPPKFVVDPGIYRVLASTRDLPSESPPQDLAWPLQDRSLDSIDLVGTKPHFGEKAQSVSLLTRFFGAEPFFNTAPANAGTGVPTNAVTPNSYFTESGNLKVAGIDYPYTAVDKVSTLLATIKQDDQRFEIQLDETTHQFTVTAKRPGTRGNGVAVEFFGSARRARLSPTANGGNAVDLTIIHGPFLDSNGLIWHTVREREVPLEICFDSEAAGSLSAQAGEVPSLVHRLAQGSRLRYSQRDVVLFDRDIPTSPGPTKWTPPDFPGVVIQWLIAPVLVVGDQHQIAKQSAVIDRTVPGATIKRQTENLLCLSMPQGEGGALITCVFSTTRLDLETPEALPEEVVAAAMKGFAAAGIIVQRTMREGSAAIFRVTPRELERLPVAEQSDAVTLNSATQRRIRRIESRRFAIAAAGPANRARVTETGHYLPVSGPSLPPTKWPARQLHFADTTRPRTPPREAHANSVGVFVSERTLFHNQAPRNGCPSGVSFSEVDQDPHLFHPAAVTIQYAPDKPGAVAELRCQGIEQTADGLAAAPLSEVATRESLQLEPPPGAAIALEGIPLHREVPFRQCERVSVRWKETLGSLPLAPTGLYTAVPLQQDVPAPSDVKDVKVHFELLPESADNPVPVPFAQCLLRMHDDVLELSASEARFPVYDARAAARTLRDLGPRDEREMPALAPLTGSPNYLTTVETSTGPVVLIISPKQGGTPARAEWRIAHDLAPIGHLNALAASNDISVAIAHSSSGAPFILTNDSGAARGLFDVKWDGTAPAERNFGGATVNGIVAVAAAWRILSMPDGKAVAVTFKAALKQLGGGQAQVLLWWTANPGQTIEQEKSIDLGSINSESHLECAITVNPYTDGSASGMLAELTIAVASPTALVTTKVGLKFDASAPGSSPTVVDFANPSKFPVTNRSCWTLQSRVDSGREQTFLFIGTVDGVVAECDAIDGSGRRETRHGGRPVQVSLSPSPLGSLLSVVVETGGSHATAVWHLATSRQLRNLRPAVAGALAYTRVSPVTLPQSPALLVAVDNASPPALHMFDLRTSSVVPPEIYFASPVPKIFDDVKLDCTIEGQSSPVTLTFTPKLVMEEPNGHLHRTDLFAVFPYQGIQSGFHIWKFDPSLAPAGSKVDLDWENAEKLRFSWHAEAASVDIEASLFEPLAKKTVAPQPFSSTAARLAIVAFVDARGGTRTPLFQRNALCGDAASSQPSEPEVIDVSGAGDLHFALCTRDTENLDLPVPGPNPLLDLLIVKHFPLGQAIACGWRDT